MVSDSLWPNKCSKYFHVINESCIEGLYREVVVYFDDMLVFSRSLSGHVGHLRDVLSILRVNQLYAKIDICTFYVDSVVFLGFVIKKTGSF